MLPKVFEKAISNDNYPRIFLGLAGGASHGAFTAGVLETLEETHMPLPNNSPSSQQKELSVLECVVGVSGTSAGANNAVAFIEGMEQKKSGGVARAMERLWGGIGRKGDSMKVVTDAARTGTGVRWPNLPPSFREQLIKAERLRGFAVYQFGIFAQMPHMRPFTNSQSEHVRDHINDVIPDWKVIKNSKIKLCIGATRIEKDKNGNEIKFEHNFYNKDADADAVAASAAVIGEHVKDGRVFRDGAEKKNPVMSGFMQDHEYDMQLVIMLEDEPDYVHANHENNHVASDPDGLIRKETYSHLAHEIERGQNVQVIRLNMERVRQILIERGRKVPDKIDETSKMTSDSEWVSALRQAGREAALEWAQEYKKDFGISSQYKPSRREHFGPHQVLQNIPEVA